MHTTVKMVSVSLGWWSKGTLCYSYCCSTAEVLGGEGQQSLSERWWSGGRRTVETVFMLVGAPPPSPASTTGGGHELGRVSCLSLASWQTLHRPRGVGFARILAFTGGRWKAGIARDWSRFETAEDETVGSRGWRQVSGWARGRKGGLRGLKCVNEMRVGCKRMSTPRYYEGKERNYCQHLPFLSNTTKPCMPCYVTTAIVYYLIRLGPPCKFPAAFCLFLVVAASGPKRATRSLISRILQQF